MRNFYPIPQAAFNGQLSGQPMNDGRRQAQVVKTKVQWATYSVGLLPLGNANPQFNVTFDLNNAGPATVSQAWIINSIYIDNTGVSFPVYVYFPDTDYTVSCPPNAAGWFKAFTIQRRAWIVGLGISNLDISNQATTTVYFTDALSVPYVDPENPSSVQLGLASPTITFGGAGGGLASVGIITTGSGYQNGLMSVVGGGGNGATAFGTINNYGQFVAVNFTPGQGYYGPPLITATGPQNLLPVWVSGQGANVGTRVQYGSFYYIANTNWAANSLQSTITPNNTSTGFGALWSNTGIIANQTAAFNSSQFPIIGGNTINNAFNYTPRAIGDQAKNYLDQITAGGVFRNNLWGTPYGTGYIYLTSVHVAQLSTPTSAQLWQIEDATGDVLFTFQSIGGNGTLLHLDNCNIRLPASSTWRINCTSFISTSVVSHGFSYTYSQTYPEG